MLRKQETINSTLPYQLVEEIRQTFNSFGNQNYSLPITTLPQLLHQMKLQIPQSTLKELNRLSSINPQPHFNIKQFSHIVARLIIEDEIQEEIKGLFSLMDRDADGWVGAQDLWNIIKEIEPAWTEEDIDQLMHEMDYSKVGYLTYEDVIFALTPK